ncbi:MAG: DNA-directed RNA polymerase subunit omega [Deltaproteobacteria bacterium]|nr:DNA-directed RNA polymerase subunit omega [Deltaproteobacteria bacterium]
MARVTVEDCLRKVDNHFQLTVVAAKRAKQLYAGAGATIDTSGRKEKPTVIALREVAQGKVRVK